MESELLEYKDELHFDLDILSQHEQIFSEEANFSTGAESNSKRPASLMMSIQCFFETRLEASA